MVLRDRLIEAIGTLGLYDIKTSIDEILVAGINSRTTPGKILCDLLETEMAEQKVRSIRHRMSLATFPVDKDLDRFEFTASPVNEMQIRNLHEDRFISDHTNVIIVGGTGTDKTHLAISIARQNIRNERKAKFFNMLDLATPFEQRENRKPRRETGRTLDQ